MERREILQNEDILNSPFLYYRLFFFLLWAFRIIFTVIKLCGFVCVCVYLSLAQSDTPVGIRLSVKWR